MFDREMLRNEKLIEERMDYEKSFLSMEPNDSEFEFTVSNYCTGHVAIEEAFDFELAEPLDDYLDQLRDEKLIDERISYEIECLKDFEGAEIKRDFVDYQIEAYLEPDFEFDLEMDDYDLDFDYFEDSPFDCYWEEPNLRKPRCGCDRDYMPHDDYDDASECYFYPDGSLLGIYPL